MNEEGTMILIDYIPCEECVNEDIWYICQKCGKCGRVFDEYGFMTDDGGTTVKDYTEEDDG